MFLEDEPETEELDTPAVETPAGDPPASDLESERRRRAKAEKEAIAERKKRQDLQQQLAAKEQWQEDLAKDPHFQMAMRAYQDGVDPEQVMKMLEAIKKPSAAPTKPQGEPQVQVVADPRVDELERRTAQDREIAEVERFCRDYRVKRGSAKAKELADLHRELTGGRPMTYQTLEKLAKNNGLRKLEPEPVDEVEDDLPFASERGFSAPVRDTSDPLDGLNPGDPRYTQKLAERAIENFNKSRSGRARG